MSNINHPVIMAAADVAELESVVLTDTLVLFWHGPFSQWHHSPFVVGASLYDASVGEMKCCNAEQYIMAEKALLFGDREAYRNIMAADNPRRMKALGRLVRGFADARWRDERVKIVTRENYEKFRQNDDIRRLLLATGELEIAEGSPYDTIWGIGLRYDSQAARNTTNWKGANLLGKCLCAARAQLLADTVGATGDR